MLGAHIACRLQMEGYEVTCIHHKSSKALFENISKSYSISASAFSWVQADILDMDTLLPVFSGMDVVVHCAALVSYRKQDSDLLYETNVSGTRNCCNAAWKVRVSQFVYMSSIAALGKDVHSDFITEETPWVDSSRLTEYSKTKYYAELEVWRIAEEGLPVSILNPGVVIGAGDGKSGSNAIFGQVAKGLRFYPIGTTGFVGIEDVAMAALSVIKNSITGNRYLLVSENLTYKELLMEVAKCMGKPAPKIRLGGVLLFVSTLIAKACEMLSIPFPFPSQGLVSTSASFKYKNSNPLLLPDFQYTPVQKSVQTAVSGLKGLA